MIITLGAIFGIILGNNFKETILFCEIILFIVFINIRKKQPNAGVALFFRKLGERKCPTPTRFGGMQKIVKNYFRYIKCIFNKKVIITLIISTTIFNMYTTFINNTYEKFYKKVGKKVVLEAVIISSPIENEYFNSYTIKGKTDEFSNKKFILYIKKETKLEYGDRIRIIGTFSEPDDTRNYKGFSYKNYLKTQKIYGSIKAEKIEVKSKNNTVFIFKLNNNIRNKIIENIKIVLPEESSGLLLGIMLGDKTYISDKIMLYFQKSSLAHILAVSGAHVSYIILGLNYIVSINKMPKKSGYVFIILILIVFIFITNFSVSVIRACIMSIILILSKLFYRKSDILNTIAISILILIIFNPYSINSVSAQLSYLGTIGVIYVSPITEGILTQISKSRGLILFFKAILGVEITKRLQKKIISNTDEIWRTEKDNKNYKYSNSCTSHNITDNGKKL